MAKVSEPPGKLDAALLAAAAAAAGGAVNGPEGEVLDWHAVDWRAVEDNVGRLRQRIFTASQAGDLAKVRNLQKLMLRSLSNTLASVRRVTEHNAGRLTAGVDGEVVVTPHAKAELAMRAHRQRGSRQARPVRRVYVPKANGKQRPLGIPVIVDRVHQARVRNALEPEWEARFEPKSYGFRPGRGCQDAIAAIYLTLKGRNPQRRWVLDANLAGAFDRIDHDHLLGMLRDFPAKGIAGWLAAGVVEDGRFTPTGEGTPQGGVISPLLLALHGLANRSQRSHGFCSAPFATSRCELAMHAPRCRPIPQRASSRPSCASLRTASSTTLWSLTVSRTSPATRAAPSSSGPTPRRQLSPTPACRRGTRFEALR
jgi:RNA-directed DNA polymerase